MKIKLTHPDYEPVECEGDTYDRLISEVRSVFNSVARRDLWLPNIPIAAITETIGIKCSDKEWSMTLEAGDE